MYEIMALCLLCGMKIFPIGNSQSRGMYEIPFITHESHIRCSLVANPLKITLKELMADYENVTYPITLVCAGNRRKEQNVVRKSKGFSWGPAGVSTALFTGVVMKDIIERAKPLRRARYVCMEGADKLVSIPIGNAGSVLIRIAQWLLRYLGQAQLGHGSKPRHHACPWHERRNAETRSRSTTSSSYPRPNWRQKCEVVEETHHYC